MRVVDRGSKGYYGHIGMMQNFLFSFPGGFYVWVNSATADLEYVFDPRKVEVIDAAVSKNKNDFREVGIVRGLCEGFAEASDEESLERIAGEIFRTAYQIIIHDYANKITMEDIDPHGLYRDYAQIEEDRYRRKRKRPKKKEWWREGEPPPWEE